MQVCNMPVPGATHSPSTLLLHPLPAHPGLNYNPTPGFGGQAAPEPRRSPAEALCASGISSLTTWTQC